MNALVYTEILRMIQIQPQDNLGKRLGKRTRAKSHSNVLKSASRHCVLYGMERAPP